MNGLKIMIIIAIGLIIGRLWGALPAVIFLLAAILLDDKTPPNDNTTNRPAGC